MNIISSLSGYKLQSIKAYQTLKNRSWHLDFKQRHIKGATPHVVDQYLGSYLPNRNEDMLEMYTMKF